MAHRSLLVVLLFALALLGVMSAGPAAYAQGPVPTPTPDTGGFQTHPDSSSLPEASAANELDKIYAIVQMVSDLWRGRIAPNADQLWEQSKRQTADWLAYQGTGLFFLDFADPNLGINQFAVTMARNLLTLTPLYVIAYLVLLVYSVYKERPIPNPLLYAALVIAVMLFLAAFAVIMQGMSELGRALAMALGGGGDAQFWARATLFDQVMRILSHLQQYGGLFSLLALLASIVLFLIVLLQLVYRGIALALLRLLAVVVIPFSVLLEGTRPRAAGRVLAGFFEAWFDLVTKTAVLLIVLALAASQAFAPFVWLVLPAGLLLVVLSWQFFRIPFVMLREALGRMYADMLPATVGDYAASLPSFEAAQTRAIDEARRQMVQEE